jgi:hypothetical protein
MIVLSFTPNYRGIAIDVDLRFSFGFILEHFPDGNKAIKEEMRKTENRAVDLFVPTDRRNNPCIRSEKCC